MSFLHGTSLLIGDNTVPGVQLPKDLKELIPKILKACKDWGLDFYPTVVQLLTYDEISEIAAYGGFPVRFPHWSFGAEYEELQRGYEFGAHKIYEMVVNCCEFATKILTKEGSKTAVEVKIGDIIMGPGGWRNVIAVKKQPVSSVCKISCEELILKTVCTPNHKWKCIRNGEAVWVETKDIVSGDVIQAGSEYGNFLNHPAKITWSPENIISETRPNVRNRLLPIEPPKVMTLELAELMGALTGDGSVGIRLASQLLSISVHKPQVKYQKYLASLFLKVFNREATIDEKKSVNLVRLASKFAVDFMNEAGLKKGCTYRNKRVPWSIWASSNEYRAAFIRGLFDTDGHCGKSLSLSCFTDELAGDIQLLLLEMDIRSKVFRVKNKHNDIAILTIKGKRNIRLFSKLIGFSLEYKAQSLANLVDKDGRSGRGQPLPGLMQKVFNRIDNIILPPEWMYKYRRRTLESEVTSNSLYGFLKKAVDEGYEENFGDLLLLAEKPVYVVSSVEEADPVETIDIALDHEDHDFLANGLISHNTNPCYIYNLSSNTLGDHLTVVAHATGHNDFFKNNIHFSATDTNMLNKMANHGTRFRKYQARWGKERVTEFVDWVMRLETLIDGAEAWTEQVVKDKNIRDERKYRQPRRLKVNKDRMYMEPFINTVEFRKQERAKIEKRDIADEIGVFKEPTRNILGFLRDNAPLKPWQADIVSMLYEEAMYFYPQRQTKTINEGWASTVDSVIMAEQGYISLGQKGHDHGIIEYAEHKMGVLGGKYSMNPYKLGFYLLKDIRERWDKGRFGTEWDECTDFRIKENWDTKANLGKEKIFEVRKYYDDLTFIHEFFTEDFCREQEYFHWKHYPNGEFKIESRDFKVIKKKLMERHLNGGLPDIRLVEPNYRGKGSMLLQHYFDGRDIYGSYVPDVLTALRSIWGQDVYLVTGDRDAGNETVFCCYGTDSQKDVEHISRKEFLKRG